MMMTKQKTSLTERLNIGNEVRELRLGATFNPKNTSTAFHTIKYDFKPASVDTSRMASVDVGSNNQVTVTVPNLESSGVPQTVYKGNHRKYTKECLMIYDKETGAIIIEKLDHHIQVKKTRSEMTNKQNMLPITNANSGNTGNGAGASTNTTTTGGGVGTGLAGSAQGPKLENSTMRITSKTKVSTGSRRNNIIDFKPRNSPRQQSSPSRPVVSHRSPQSAPAWHANNGQQTLPSIPMITDDDDFGFGASFHNDATQMGQRQQHQELSASGQIGNKQRQTQGNKRQQIKQRLSPPTQHQSATNHGRGYNGATNFAQQSKQQSQHPQHPHQQQLERHSSPAQHQQQQYHAQHQRVPVGQSLPMDLDSPMPHEISSQSMAQAAAALEQRIGGALSASSSSSDSDSSDSDSGSDSDDSTEDEEPTPQQQQQLRQQPPMNQLPNLGLGSLSPAYNHNTQQPPQLSQNSQRQQQVQQPSGGIYGHNGNFPNDLLQNDLQLSSNSSDDDD